jgi:phospholipase D1/2
MVLNILFVVVLVQEAERIICVSGWSVWDKLRLFRGSDVAIDGRTLGELLLARANEGVDVYVMVW